MYVLLSAVTIRPNLRFSEESLLKNYEHPQHPFKVEKKTVLNRGAFRFLIITIEFWGHRNNKATLLTTQWTWEFPRRHVYLPHKILSKFFSRNFTSSQKSYYLTDDLLNPEEDAKLNNAVTCPASTPLSRRPQPTSTGKARLYTVQARAHVHSYTETLNFNQVIIINSCTLVAVVWFADDASDSRMHRARKEGERL